MENRSFFLIIVVYASTVLWGILAFFVYLSTVQEYPFLKNAGLLEILFTGDLFVRLLVLLSSYLLAICIGLVFYSEKSFWYEK